MVRRTGRHTQLGVWWRQLLRFDFGAACFLIAIFALIVLFVSAAVLASLHGEAASDTGLAQYLQALPNQQHHDSQQTVALRKTRAKQLVAAYEGSGELLASAISDEQRMAIEQTAETGKAPKGLDIDAPSYTWLYLILVGAAVCWSAALLYAQVNVSSSHSWFIADMPWRKPWTWLLVLLTLPVGGFIAWPISAIRFRRWLSEQDPAIAEAQQNADPNYPGQVPRVDGEYYSSPQAARELYRSLRGTGWKARLEKAVSRATDAVEDAESELRQAAETVREAQAFLGQAKAQQRAARDAVENYRDEVAASLVEEEFDTILKLKGVTAVQVVNGNLILIVSATFPYKGKTYDLGDWELTLGFSRFDSRQLRDATRTTWPDRYPSYRLYGGGFCFGTRGTTIQNHVNKGQFLEAAQLAVATIQSVNEEDLENVPKAFKEVKQ